MVQEMCKLNCGEVLRREEFVRHEKENCTHRVIKCDHCDENFKYYQLDKHHDECLKMKVLCDLCDTKITREVMEQHLKHDCGMVQETCTLGCGMELTRDKLGIHEKDNCVQRIIQCEHCCIEVKFCFNSKHLKECPLVKETCYQCSVEKYRKDMTQHLEDECPEKMLDCPFVKYKCLVRIKRKDTDKHLEEKKTEHFGLKLTAMENLITEQSEIINKQSEEINKTNKIITEQSEIMNTQSEIMNTQSEIMNTQSEEINKQREEINKQSKEINKTNKIITEQNEEIDKQSEEIEKLNENIEKQNKVMTREISNTSQQIEMLCSTTDTTKITWKVEDVRFTPDFSMSQQYEVAGYRFVFKFQNYGKVIIVFPGTAIKSIRPFIAKCNIMLQSCYRINCGMIEVKQKDLTRGCERVITSISQEDIVKYSEPQFPGATKNDLILEIFVTM